MTDYKDYRRSVRLALKEDPLFVDITTKMVKVKERRLNLKTVTKALAAALESSNLTQSD